MKYSYNEILPNNKETNYWYKREGEWIPKSSNWVKEARQKRLYFIVAEVIAMLMVKKQLTAKVLKETFECVGNVLYPDYWTLKTTQYERKKIIFTFAKGGCPSFGSLVINTLKN